MSTMRLLGIPPETSVHGGERAAAPSQTNSPGRLAPQLGSNYPYRRFRHRLGILPKRAHRSLCCPDDEYSQCYICSWFFRWRTAHCYS